LSRPAPEYKAQIDEKNTRKEPAGVDGDKRVWITQGAALGRHVFLYRGAAKFVLLEWRGSTRP
jgi:hypothetical protein